MSISPATPSPTRCARRTRRKPTAGWSRSSGASTRPTCSGSTRTFPQTQPDEAPMQYDSFTSSIAEQRRRTFLDDAERHTRAKAVQQHSVPPHSSLVQAALIRIRPVEPSDTALLQAAFDRLSPESRQFRFLFPKVQLSAAELRYFTDVVHHDH